MKYQIKPASRLRGDIEVPGDKSISHRSIMLAAIAEGVSHVSGFLEGEDCLATLNAFKSMGVTIEGPCEGHLTIYGAGLHGLNAPQLSKSENAVLDLGNSGTSIRLLSGLLAGQRFSTTLTGDDSLLSRPMGRVVEPLRMMGATIESSTAGRPPLNIHGFKQDRATLQSISYVMPIASAQVKSCLLLAGLYADGNTSIVEPAPTRDHTERMLRGFGVEVVTSPIDGADSLGRSAISIQSNQTLTATNLQIPGDISSAAFFIVAGLIIPDSDIVIKNVGINPTRIGCLTILKLMGAKIELLNSREVCGEPVADIHVMASKLRGIEIPVAQIPLAIDEFPVIFIAAACAEGQTILRNARELRVKESDRIHVMAVGLHKLDIECEELEDGMIITGGELQGGEVDSHGDHRIAMAFSIAALALRDPESHVVVNDCDNVKTSFPGFIDALRSVGATIAS